MAKSCCNCLRKAPVVLWSHQKEMGGKEEKKKEPLGGWHSEGRDLEGKVVNQ